MCLGLQTEICPHRDGYVCEAHRKVQKRLRSGCGEPTRYAEAPPVSHCPDLSLPASKLCCCVCSCSSRLWLTGEVWWLSFLDLLPLVALGSLWLCPYPHPLPQDPEPLPAPPSLHLSSSGSFQITSPPGSLPGSSCTQLGIPQGSLPRDIAV